MHEVDLIVILFQDLTKRLGKANVIFNYKYLHAVSFSRRMSHLILVSNLKASLNYGFPFSRF